MSRYLHAIYIEHLNTGLSLSTQGLVKAKLKKEKQPRSDAVACAMYISPAVLPSPIYFAGGNSITKP